MSKPHERIFKKGGKTMNSYELSKRIYDCISDGHDDETKREKAVTALYNDLSQIGNNNIKVALVALCERVEALKEAT